MSCRPPGSRSASFGRALLILAAFAAVVPAKKRAQYVFPVLDYGFLTMKCQYNWKDDQRQSPTNRPPSDIVPDRGLVDAFVSFETTDGKWRFDLFGRNLADEEYLVFVFSPKDWGTPYFNYKGMYGAPRTLGARLTYRFGGP